MPSWPTILEFHSCPFHLGVSSCKNVVEISLQQIFKGPFATMTAYILYNAKNYMWLFVFEFSWWDLHCDQI